MAVRLHGKVRKGSKDEAWTQYSRRSREWEDLYRNRWRYDKIVRSTHGVNCTGSCSWKIYVKNGIITWETQQTDYPSNGSEFPEYEPRGCPRGATFSWYAYSPIRVKYPYVRGELLKLWREERSRHSDPLDAWRAIVENPGKRESYVRARGKGGFVRSSWDEVTEIISASLLQTIKSYGPDRIVGFTPIPAMSMVSYAAGSRFLSLIGGTMLSFYDWYADLPPASPQIWGEQTDVPESADWYNSKYMIIWGTNLPMTRTPDAHFMVEARYNGTKVVGVSPDYSEYIKFCDHWLPARAGTDAALALSMAHVIVKEFYVDKETEYFTDYAKRYTDLPFLVTLRKEGDAYRSGRYLNSADLGNSGEYERWKPVIWDDISKTIRVPVGSMGFRYDGSSRWNLEQKDTNGIKISPVLSFADKYDEILPVEFPFFGETSSSVSVRGVPARKVMASDGSEIFITTVFDLFVANLGVDRGFDGNYAHSYDDDAPYTPAWQEKITGVDRKLAEKVAREFAENAAKTKGRSMIALGAGTNHWLHSDVIYRSIISLVMLTGSEGVNGGGWAHYVGQEKVRPLEGWSTVAFANDWIRPPRLQNGTSFFYLSSDQFHYDRKISEKAISPFRGKYTKKHPLDMIALAVRLGWQASYPQFDRNPLDLVREARESGLTDTADIAGHVRDLIHSGKVHFSVEDPDNPVNFPRVMFIWRSNLLGASGKGYEYFIKHMIGSDGHPLLGDESYWKPEDVSISSEAPRGKLDLLVDLDFRMTSTSLYSDIVLPAATWYEKRDISSTDMHPFIHPFDAAISPPWETRSDWDAFTSIAKRFSEMAERYLPEVEDIVSTPLLHDSIGEISQPEGKVPDWRDSRAVPEIGRNFPNLTVVKRSYRDVYRMMVTLGPLAEKSLATKGIAISGEKAYREVLSRLPASRHDGPTRGRPLMEKAEQVADAILTLSGASNGERAREEWERLGEITGLPLAEEMSGSEDVKYSYADLLIQPRRAMATPVWSGSEKGGRKYSPFTTNVEHKVPWRTLTGRQHFYLDHEILLEFAEGLPIYKPPLGPGSFTVDDESKLPHDGKFIQVRYLTPHQKWGIHSTYTDTPTMLTLFRGGQTVWLNEEDARSIGVEDNDWIEVYNGNGSIAARAVVTYRIPRGVAIMYHAQDRTVGVPASELTRDRGGTHNSVTKIIIKPTHLVGGYAQLSYFFNYYGPTGHQRDAIAYVRKLKEVKWLEH